MAVREDSRFRVALSKRCTGAGGAVLILGLLTAGLGTALAQRPGGPIGEKIELPAIPKIERIVGEISAANLKRHVETLAAIPSRHVASSTMEQAWTYIADEMRKNPKLKVELDEWDMEVARLQGRKVHMVNVVATLPGKTDPDRYYVVSGHYDSRASNPRDPESRAPGAVDDGSGTAAVMELARVFSQYDFDATLVFVAVSGEEMGLLGAAHWAEMAKRKGLNVDAMITNDIVGNSHGGGGHASDKEMRVFSEGIPVTETDRQANLRRSIGGENDSPARQLARYVKMAGERYVPGFEVHTIYRRDRFGRGGDHTAFSQQGYAAVRFSEMFENYYRQHQDVRTEDGIEYGDVAEHFDAAYSAKIVRVDAAVLASLADAPAPPGDVRIGGGVSYDTKLAWEASKDSDLKGYEILVRDTESPFWERRVSVGNVTEYTLEGVIVDNHFFAVQSVDAQGNRSLPVFPQGNLRRRR